MRRIPIAKIFIAVVFFILGYVTNHLIEEYKTKAIITEKGEERFPVNPMDFDQKSMMDTIERMNREGDEMMGASSMGVVSHREDEKYFYYDIPLTDQDGTDHKLNVEIKNGMVKISEDVKSRGDSMIETNSERMFTIDPALDADKAEVINQKDKIVIKIPKR